MDNENNNNYEVEENKPDYAEKTEPAYEQTDVGNDMLLSRKKKAGLLQPLTIFAIGLLLLVFVCGPIQYAWGMYGVAATEIIILLYAFIAARLCRFDFKQTFPVGFPSLRRIFGTAIMWYGTYKLLLVVAMLLGYLFPEQYAGTSESISGIMRGLPPVVIFLIMTVMPAICEEALFRGVILTSLRRLDKKWLAIILCGVMFGIYHMNFIKFFSTGLLGIAMAYLLIKTGNMLYPILFHFINNAVSTWPILFMDEFSGAVEQAGELNIASIINIQMVGIYAIIAATAPIWILVGIKLLEDKPVKNNFTLVKTQKKSQTRRWLTAVGLSVAIALAGVVILIKNPIDLEDFGFTEDYFEQQEDLGQPQYDEGHSPVKSAADGYIYF